jgi:hypothetical protein
MTPTRNQKTFTLAQLKQIAEKAIERRRKEVTTFQYEGADYRSGCAVTCDVLEMYLEEELRELSI